MRATEKRHKSNFVYCGENKTRGPNDVAGMIFQKEKKIWFYLQQSKNLASCAPENQQSLKISKLNEKME